VRRRDAHALTVMRRTPPIVFIHGPWLHTSSWQPWLDFFRAAGFEVHAPRWPGEAPTVQETRRHPERMGGFGYNALTRHYGRIIEEREEEPIVIGHSVGGHVAQRLLGMGLARAAIALAPLQFRGVRGLPPSQLPAVAPLLRNPVNYYRAVTLTPEQFHRIFANELSQKESDELYVRYSIPSTVRPVFQSTLANLAFRSKARINTDNRNAGPLLIVAGEKDRLVPVWIAQEEAQRFSKAPAFTIVPGRGHSLVVDSGWRQVAELCLRWLARHDLAPSLPERPRPRAEAPVETEQPRAGK